MVFLIGSEEFLFPVHTMSVIHNANTFHLDY